MKNKLFLMSVFCLSLIFFCNIAVMALSKTELAAESAILMDFTTGQVLFEKNADQPAPPASTTKIVTALVALERGDLKQEIVVSDNASRAEGSSVYLSGGETHSLEELLYGVLLSSGNDASLAVAEGLAGSETLFADWMNQKAQALGAKSSNFKNCSGLPEEGHYTTAYDLALITRYALNNPVFDAMVKTKSKNLSWPGKEHDRLLYNHNKLLWRYQFADGVKTGYTREAGRCLVSSATKNGHRLITVVFNSKLMYEDSQRLFEYGFDNYQLIGLVSNQERLGKVEVLAGIKDRIPVLPNRPLTLLLKKGMLEKLKVNLEMRRYVEAPVERMQEVGTLRVKLGNEILETVPVVAAESVPRKSFFQKIVDWVKGIFTPLNILHNSNR
jgi:D-alanyl-D-alanine carboxypeptidase (penicillin-binding protein 5/6)